MIAPREALKNGRTHEVQVDTEELIAGIKIVKLERGADLVVRIVLLLVLMLTVVVLVRLSDAVDRLSGTVAVKEFQVILKKE